ncbi:MAG: 5'/3'-nucleotidase SurE [Campylobacterales bacterium]|nr:5'/3'-nucleotidase SurE [Campylobacterales bacterium]
MKEILITNDDGYEADGIHALVDAVKNLAKVTVVAPALEKSACGHGITLTRPLRFVSIDDDFYKLDDGTPSDCIYLALNTLYENKKPDLVISGINRGANMGEDITYSGTAAGAMEGVLNGVPSIAISQVMTKTEDGSYDYSLDLAKDVIKDIVTKIFDGEFPLPERRFLNINVPNITKDLYKGYQITKAGYRHYGNDAHMHRNPRGEEYYWLGLHPLDFKEEKGSDYQAILDGYTSITPVMLDLTSYDDIDNLKKWIK